MKKNSKIAKTRKNRQEPLDTSKSNHPRRAGFIFGWAIVLSVLILSIKSLLSFPWGQPSNTLLLVILLCNLFSMVGFAKRWNVLYQRSLMWVFIGLLLMTLCWSVGSLNVDPAANIATLPVGLTCLLIGIGVWFLPVIRQKIADKLRNIGSVFEANRQEQPAQKLRFNLWAAGGLLAIIVLFTAVKMPYFGLSFTGEHNLKYAWSVELAQHMSEHNSPFWFQTKYVLDPTNNPDGKLASLDVFPAMEWGLFATYEILPFNSIETNTRIFTHLCGLVLLILAYAFFRYHFPRRLALLIVLLLAVNPIINFATYVTVYDSLIMIGTFVSLIFIERFVRRRALADLFLAGAVLGLSVSIKFSVALWLVPSVLILLLWRRQNWRGFFTDAIVYAAIGALPLIGLRFVLRYLTDRPTVGLIVLGVLIGIMVSLYYVLKQVEPRFRSMTGFLLGNVWTKWVMVGMAVIAAYAVIKYTGLGAFNDNFLTDGRLIGNWSMYRFMLFDQFRSYMTPELFYAGVFGLLAALLLGKRNVTVVLTSLLAGAFSYWVAASKVIFFHNYYSLIVMVLFTAAAGVGMYILISMTSHRIIKVLVLAGALVILLPTGIQAARGHLSQQNRLFSEAAQYLTEHTSPGDLYLDDESSSPYFVVKTGVGRVWRSHLSRPEVKASIQREGFKTTMDKYRIKYLITQRMEPNYSLYANIFSQADLESNTVIDRGHLILTMLSGKAEQFSDQNERQKVIKRQNLEDRFVLEKTIGSYRFYRFAD